MVYPASFHRIVAIGNLYADTFNFTLSMVPAGGGSLPAVSDTLVAAVGATVADWFNNPMTAGSETGINIASVCALTSVKVNRIGPDGRYVDAETKEHVLTTPVAGPYGTVIQPQLSVALTLRGANERARAGRGRIFFPPSENCGGTLTDGRVSVAKTLSHAKGGLHLLSMINDTYIAQGVNAVAGIASKVGSGAFQPVVQVSAGRVVDTIRSRRSKLDEDPQYWGMP